jgi:hypothetical protein
MMITFTGNHVTVNPFKGTTYQVETVRYAVKSYGYLVGSRSPLMMPKKVTFGEFADIIGSVYDLTTPQNNEVVRVLRAVQSTNQ